jgi:hypothetical protein
MSTELIERPDLGFYVTKTAGPPTSDGDRRLVQIDVDRPGGYTQMAWNEYAAIVKEMMAGVRKEERERKSAIII